ncbi:mechanosensitive ion channel [Thiomicrorhabdus sp. zzn3]|uniref:mechanosensitive ion channel domain-containing protein n=1 Tax=Thiomicrorhabdus sp. zzn3 TaxID=3039775 RepID=UPI002436BB9F|nr:mechanosensitive ion channel domain-containing protein [Thiomicrorhabdus sp. zzn3]MDG6777117.1 mechanosensitive ion channel [Thiomicrorhabdus sp. zzn3]
MKPASLLTAFLFSCFYLVASLAAPTVQPLNENLIHQSDVERLNQQLKVNEEFDEAQKQELASQLDKASSWIQEASTSEQEQQHLKQQIEAAQSHLNKLANSQKVLQEALKQESALKIDSLTETQVNKAYNDASQALLNAEQNLAHWDKMLTEYLALATEGVEQKTQYEKSIAQLQGNQSKLAADTTDLAQSIQNLAIQARLQALKASVKTLNFKLDNLAALTELAQAERDYWSNDKLLLQKSVQTLQSRLQSEKAREAEAALQQVLEESIDSSSVLYPLQQQLIDVQTQKTELVHLEKLIDHKIALSQNAISTIESHFTRDKQVVELEGSQETIAQVLHQRLQTLPNLQISSREVLRTKDQINEAVLQQLLLNEKLREASQLSVTEIIAQLQPSTASPESEPDQTALQQKALQLHEQYLQAAKELQNLYPSYISKLAELNSVYSQQQEQSQNYSRFLNDHLLWLPNVNLIALISVEAFNASLLWLLAPERLALLLHDTTTVIQSHNLLLLFWLLVFAGLISARRHFTRGLKQTASQMTSIRTDNYLLTLMAVGYTLLLTLPIPWLMFGAAAILNQLDTPSGYSQNLIKGLIDAGLLLFVLTGLKQICRADGLAERHFHWHISVRHALQKELAWAAPLGALSIMLIDLSSDANGPAETQLIGRLAFVGLMIGFAVLIYRLWSNRSEIMRDFATSKKNSTWQQLHFLWFPLLFAFPLFLIWTTVYGYYYSALVIAERFNWTLGLILVIYTFRELLLRGIYLSERKRHYEELLQKRQALQQTLTKDSASESEATPPLEEPELMDYEKLSKQARQALNLGFILAFLFGLWIVWSDVIPALNLISDSTLSLTKAEWVDGVQQQVPLTLGDLVLGIALGAMTLLLSKDLPGLLEFTLLKHLPISNAARYAITSLTQYIIAIIGFVLIFRALGIEWSNIQWLVAALGVGLGFGLQEIVANFVSGIILLFEQPMRVGDIVTVDGVSGKVSKIRIRATTIVNWDRQELVIPNKQIITGQFINWSLSDQVMRVKVDVGIAYGSDVTKALKLIQEAATEHPDVLDDPEPSVIFDSFGDNALQLSLRVYVDDLDNFLKIKSELHTLINDKLNQAGIVIAFPQRDVHLDTTRPLEIQLTKARKKTSDDSPPMAKTLASD